MKRLMSSPTVVIAVIAVLVIAAVIFLAGCGAPVYRVQLVVGIPGGRISVSCSNSSGARRILVLPGYRATSVHVGDVCPA